MKELLKRGDAAMPKRTNTFVMHSDIKPQVPAATMKTSGYVNYAAE